MVKNFKNIFLRNQEADDFETWYTASDTRVYRVYQPWVDLDYFYDRVKFVSECFCMGESLYSNEC